MIGPSPTNHEALNAEPIGRQLKPGGSPGTTDWRDKSQGCEGVQETRRGNRGSLNALGYLG